MASGRPGTARARPGEGAHLPDGPGTETAAAGQVQRHRQGGRAADDIGQQGVLRFPVRADPPGIAVGPVLHQGLDVAGAQPVNLIVVQVGRGRVAFSLARRSSRTSWSTSIVNRSKLRAVSVCS
jgi:hypothetical protein